MRQALLLSLVTACVSFTLSEAVIFASMRAAAHRAKPWAGKLISCGYCTGHWVAATLTGFCRPQLFPEQGPAGYVLTWLAITWLAGAQWAAMCWLVSKAEE
jgi:hypothetical protein